MSPPASLAEVAAYLDIYLRVREVPDYEGAVNGLQVENSGSVDRVVAAVDASQATIDGVAALGGSPLLLVHHGLFFDGNLPVTGRRYRRLRALLSHDVAVYSSHLPLDAHAEVGNNAVLARLLGLELQGPFGSHRGNPIGVWGRPVVVFVVALRGCVSTPTFADTRPIARNPTSAAEVGLVLMDNVKVGRQISGREPYLS